MSNQKSGFKIDFSKTPFFGEESVKIRNMNIRKKATSEKIALDFKCKCASEGFSVVPV